jgi:predicted transcriptional regulator
LNDKIEKLAEKEVTTKSEIMRKAIALVMVSVEAKHRGQKLGILDKNGRVITEIEGV